MEFTREEVREILRSQRCEVISEQKTIEYYKGFYDGIQAILKLLKEGE